MLYACNSGSSRQLHGFCMLVLTVGAMGSVMRSLQPAQPLHAEQACLMNISHVAEPTRAYRMLCLRAVKELEEEMLRRPGYVVVRSKCRPGFCMMQASKVGTALASSHSAMRVPAMASFCVLQRSFWRLCEPLLSLQPPARCFICSDCPPASSRPCCPPRYCRIISLHVDYPHSCCAAGCENTYWDDKKNPPRKGWREWKLTEGVCKGFMTAYASAAYRRGYLDDLVFEQVSGDGCITLQPPQSGCASLAVLALDQLASRAAQRLKRPSLHCICCNIPPVEARLPLLWPRLSCRIALPRAACIT
jgi:hypothetical protein